MEEEPANSALRRCSKCGFEQSPEYRECHRCGVIFSKLGHQRRLSRTDSTRVETSLSALEDSEAQAGDLLSRIRERALTLPERTNGSEIVARGIIWLALLVLGWSFMTLSIEHSQMLPSFTHFILSRVNLVFHEAGHVVFLPLGRFMSILGGSLLQVLVPLICTVAFLTRHLDTFAASVTLWWTGQSLIELAPYINDARAQELMLLGGVTGRDRPGYHDWNNLLSQLGWLRYDHFFGELVHYSGVALVALSLLWGLYLLLGQLKSGRDSRIS